ncbi:glycine cleavage system T protein [Thelephora terrestris]|uniref:Aminomethyltransferase n=1 Tax=Thelephora terrestris TaxID=56493 RepID=A0A9P6L6T1_9AGAM|nr:glycine cleavage system T protein [Thelephora terrestris]
MLRSRLPSLVAGGRRYAVQRTAPKFARFMATPSAEVSPPSSLKKTGLYDFHVENGAKMVPFAGYSMPLSYGNVGAVASHHHVRSKVGLFDVGHMVQTKFRGPTSAAFLEWLTPSSLVSLSPYSSTLSVLVNEKGGIIDDTIITKHSEDAFYVVTNAGRQEWNGDGQRSEKGKVEMEVLEGWGLLALQGPEAAKYLQTLTPFDLRSLTFGRSAFVPLEGFNLHVARGGYTGEDGFEISVPPSETVEVAKLLSQAPVQLTGLGARDSLRLEAGMCLYGQDLDEDISPVEAGLSWVIGKERKETGGFIGADLVLKHLKDGPPRRRVGFIVEGAPARQGAKVFKPSSSDLLGTVTSGIPSPTLEKNIAMGYVENGWHKKGTEVEIEVRNKLRKAVITPMPFIKPKYWRG